MVKLDKDSLLKKFEEIDDNGNVSYYVWNENISDFKNMISDNVLNRKLKMESGYKGWFTYKDEQISLSFLLNNKSHIYPEMTFLNLINDASDISILIFSDEQVDEAKYLNSF